MGRVTELAYERLPPAQRRRLVLRAALRALATTTGVVVLYYALPEHMPSIDRRFSRSETVRASDLPRYPKRSERDLTRHLLNRFQENGIRLYYLELSTPDVRDLGFYVCRTYSPDLLSLSLPSYPQAGHPRFARHGGFNVSDPHPFP